MFTSSICPYLHISNARNVSAKFKYLLRWNSIRQSVLKHFRIIETLVVCWHVFYRKIVTFSIPYISIIKIVRIYVYKLTLIILVCLVLSIEAQCLLLTQSSRFGLVKMYKSSFDMRESLSGVFKTFFHS